MGFNFAASKKDSLSLKGKVSVASKFSPAGKVVALDIGGYTPTFTLDAKGKAKSSNGDTLTLSGALKNGVYQTNTLKFAYAVKSLDLFKTLSGVGFSNDTVDGTTVILPVSWMMDGTTYSSKLTVKYSAKKGKTGSGKK